MPTILNSYGLTPYFGVPAQLNAVTLTSDASLNTSTQKVETTNQVGAKCGVLYYDLEGSFSLTLTPIFTSDGSPNAVVSTDPFNSCDSTYGSPSSKLTLAVLPTWLLSVNGTAPTTTSCCIDSTGLTYSNTAAQSLSVSGTIYRF